MVFKEAEVESNRRETGDVLVTLAVLVSCVCALTTLVQSVFYERAYDLSYYETSGLTWFVLRTIAILLFVLTPYLASYVKWAFYCAITLDLSGIVMVLLGAHGGFLPTAAQWVLVALFLIPVILLLVRHNIYRSAANYRFSIGSVMGAVGFLLFQWANGALTLYIIYAQTQMAISLPKAFARALVLFLPGRHFVQTTGAFAVPMLKGHMNRLLSYGLDASLFVTVLLTVYSYFVCKSGESGFVVTVRGVFQNAVQSAAAFMRERKAAKTEDVPMDEQEDLLFMQSMGLSEGERSLLEEIAVSEYLGEDYAEAASETMTESVIEEPELREERRKLSELIELVNETVKQVESDAEAEEVVTEEIAEPVEETVTEEIAEPAEETVTEEIAEPVEETVTEEIAEPAEETVTEEIAEPVEETVTEEIAEPAEETVTEEVAEPAEETTEEVTEPVEETVTEEVTEPVEETVTEEIAETAEEVVEPVEETVTEEVAEPVEETTTEEVTEPAEESTVTQPQPVTPRPIAACVADFGRNFASYMALDKGGKIFTGEMVEGYIPYRVIGKEAIISGGPICDDDNLEELLGEFEAFCLNKKISMTFVNVAREQAELMEILDFSLVHCGAEPRFALQNYQLKNPAAVRNQRRKIHDKFGVWIDEYRYYEERDDELEMEMIALNDDWLDSRNGDNFTIYKRRQRDAFLPQTLDFDAEDGRRYYYAVNDKRELAGYIVFCPVTAQNGYSCEAGRKRPGQIKNLMELIMHEAFAALKAEGANWASMGLMPDHLDKEQLNTRQQRWQDFVYRYYESIYACKDYSTAIPKYKPTAWEDMYIVTREYQAMKADAAAQ